MVRDHGNGIISIVKQNSSIHFYTNHVVHSYVSRYCKAFPPSTFVQIAQIRLTYNYLQTANNANKYSSNIIPWLLLQLRSQPL